MSVCERNGILKHLWSGIVAILLGLCIQTGGAVFWAGMISARMTAAEKRLDRVEQRLDATASARRP